jgi:hypothetical protein
MKTVSLWKSAMVAVVGGACLAAGVAMAEGEQVRSCNGRGYGAGRGTDTTAATAVQQRDQARGRVRDGSCQTTATQQRDRARDRARDGSCQATGSQQRGRARDGSCASR